MEIKVTLELKDLDKILDRLSGLFQVITEIGEASIKGKEALEEPATKAEEKKPVKKVTKKAEELSETEIVKPVETKAPAEAPKEIRDPQLTPDELKMQIKKVMASKDPASRQKFKTWLTDNNYTNLSAVAENRLTELLNYAEGL